MNIVICVEYSHELGMGHFFRGINLYRYFSKCGERVFFLTNYQDNEEIFLQSEGIDYRLVSFSEEDWEQDIIREHSIDVWINDRYHTPRRQYLNIKKADVLLCAIDEESGNDDLLDIHFIGMIFQNDFISKAKKVFRGTEYIVLNEEIGRYRRHRSEADKVIVSMGGSDTYGVTIKALRVLKKKLISADILIGPSFEHYEELMAEMSDGYHIFHNVPSSIELFSNYDVAVTCGGVTCMEMAALGIPSIIVANEQWEIDTARYMADIGCSIFAGYHEMINEDVFFLEQLDVSAMSQKGLAAFSENGARNIYDVIKKYSR